MLEPETADHTLVTLQIPSESGTERVGREEPRPKGLGKLGATSSCAINARRRCIDSNLIMAGDQVLKN